ncbi:LysR family transcriptional regulator [Rhodoferax sp.]|uniref:LysR family transcriptional regulator n=1 Tax=Rhodoferax sp. TaxID=50421 RepID=UPI00374CEF6F
MAKQDLRHADFRRIDLNLLVAFDALMLERHVGRAAARVFIGQSAMSHVLARLREALADDVFVRSGNRMEPTPLAQELAPHVRAWLQEANSFLFARGAFDLSRASSTIRVATLDGVESVLLPSLLQQLRGVAPGIRIWTKHVQRDEILSALDAEEVDVGIGSANMPYKEWHYSEKIAHTHYECVYAPAQLDLPEIITPEILAQQEHVALSWRGEAVSEIDRFFEARGLQRNIAVSAVSQLAIMRILQQFPLVTLQSCMITSIYRNLPGIVVRPIALGEIAMEVRLVWHRRNDKDPAQAYVRQIIKEVLMRESARQPHGLAALAPQ